MSIYGLYMKNASAYYEFCTDLGYDFYTSWNSSLHKSFLNRLIDKVAINNQSIWLVPKAIGEVFSFKSLTGGWEKTINWLMEDRLVNRIGDDQFDWLKGCTELAFNNDRVVGMAFFIWDWEKLTFCQRDLMTDDNIYYRADYKDYYLQLVDEVFSN
jgi:hypothetical protein